MADAIVSLLLEQLIIFAAEELKQQGKLVSVGWVDHSMRQIAK